MPTKPLRWRLLPRGRPWAQVLALLAGNAASAQGFTPQQVQQECVRQMAMGICRTVPDAASMPASKTMLIAGVGRVSYAAYMDYLRLYDKKKPFDTAMCRMALHYMTTAPGSDHDKIARAMWTPSPP